MANNEADLVFRIRADAAEVKRATNEARTAISQLTKSTLSEIAQVNRAGAVRIKVDTTEVARARTELGKINNLGAVALRGLTTEFSNLARQAPLVGGPLAAVVGELIRIPVAARPAEDATRKLASALKIFEGALGTAFGGSGKRANDLNLLFSSLGLNVEKSLRAPDEAFGRFLASFRAIPLEADRAAFATQVFKSRTAELLPVLEGTAAGATATGAGFASIAGPAAAAALVIAGTGAAAGLAAKVLFDLAVSSSEVGNEIFKATQKTSFSAETLSVIRVAARDAETSFDSLAAGIVRFERNLVAANRGNKELAATFQRLGIDVQAGILEPERAFAQFLASFSKLPPSANKAAVAIELFGKSGAELIPTFENLGGNLDAARQRTAELGLLMGGQAVQNAARLDDAFDELSNSWEGLKLSLGTEAIESVTQAVRAATQIIRDNRAEIVASVPTITALFGTLYDTARLVANGFGVLVHAVELAIAPFAGMVVIVASVVESLANVGNAIRALVTGDLQFLKQAWNDQIAVGERLEGRLNSIAEAARGAFRDVQSNFRGIAGILNQGASLSIEEQARRQGGRHLTPQDVQAILGGKFAGGDQLLLPPRPRASGGGGRAKGGADRAAREAEQREVKRLALFNKELEDVTRTNREILKREYDLNLKSLDEYINQALIETEEHYQNQLKAFAREEQIARRYTEKAEDLALRLREIQIGRDNALDAKRAESQKLEDDRLRTGERLELAHQRRLAEVEEIHDKQKLARLEESFDRRAILESTYQQRLRDLVVEGLDHQRELLQFELTLKTNSLERTREIYDELNKLELKRAVASEDAQRRIIDALGREQAARAPGAQGFEAAPVSFEDLLKIDPSLANIPPLNFDHWKAAIQDVKAIALDSFKSMGSALGALVEQWVLYGIEGPQALRKMVAATLAGVAAEAAVKAIFNLAEGFAKLAGFLPGPAALHFKAATLYTAVGGLAAGAGRALAGNLFTQGGGQEGNARAGREGERRNISPIEVGRNQAPPREIVLRVDVKQDPHSIVQVAVDDYKKAGPIYDLITGGGI